MATVLSTPQPAQFSRHRLTDGNSITDFGYGLSSSFLAAVLSNIVASPNSGKATGGMNHVS
jgi:hypothetical protein